MPDHLCNLIIPGAAKSGTSSLHALLDKHPEICMSKAKEPHYFSKYRNYKLGSEVHNALFRNGLTQQVRFYGESSTGYMPCPKAIERIHNDLCDPRIIIILRHPVERTFSHYRWRFRLGLEKRPLLQAVREDGDGYDPDSPDKFGYMSYLEFSRYSFFCPLWLDSFGAERVKFVSFDTLKNDPASCMRDIFTFLGLPMIELASEMQVNSTNSLVRKQLKRNPLSYLMPKSLRRSRPFQFLKQRVRAWMTPVPPQTLRGDEFAYLEDALLPDIEWFESRVNSEINKSDTRRDEGAVHA